MSDCVHNIIQEEITRRGLERMEHVILNHPIHAGIAFFLNHCLDEDYKPTKRIKPELISTLRKFELVRAAENRFSFLEYSDIDAARIWPRTQRDCVRLDADTRDVVVHLPGGAKAQVWAVTLAARRQEGDVTYYILSYYGADSVVVEQFLGAMAHLNQEIHTKEKCISVHGGTDIRLRGEHRWEDLVLDDNTLRSVKDDLEYWIASEENYRRKNIPYRRGYLFEGPPGNGKTAVARTILSTYDFSAHSFNFSNIHMDDKDLQNAFECAANAAPAVFLLEDIDRLFDGSAQYSRVTKEGLFNCLDGIATYAGIVVIATANHPECLDKAIRHRPGRFDVPVRFDNPKYEQRERFLWKLLGGRDGGENKVSQEVVGTVAEGCAGMSMAFIKLVYETAASAAFRVRNDIAVTDEDLVQGMARARGYYTQMENSRDRSAGFNSIAKPAMPDNEVTEAPMEGSDKREILGILEQPTRYTSPTRTR